MRRMFVMAVVMVGTSVGVSAEPSAADLAIRARSILKKHCAECHSGDRPETLPILDFSALTDPKRGSLPAFLKPGNPTASQLIQLVEDGSMPPGRRPRLAPEELSVLRQWAMSGSAFPKQFDDATILEWLIRDAEALPEMERRTTRYLSLHHLISDDRPAPELALARQALRAALARVSTGEPKLTPVDPTETLFRWDLRSAGWDLQPFRELSLEDGTAKRALKLNLFDVVLLEYPLGVPLEKNDLGERVTGGFLNFAAAVRPLPFVRADWFTAAIAEPRLTADLRALLRLTGEVSPRPSLPQGFPANPFGLPTPDGGIPAIDGYYTPDPALREPYGLDLKTLDKAGEETAKFRPGEGLIPQVSVEVRGWFELIWPGSDGEIFVFNLTEQNRDRLEPQKTTPLYYGDGAVKMAYPISKTTPPGTEKLVMFFSSMGLPKGTRIQAATAGKPIERFYHPLHVENPQAFRQIARKTIMFQIVKPTE